MKKQAGKVMLTLLFPQQPPLDFALLNTRLTCQWEIS